jgi:very-long-chain enoyl-CoA reductase
MVIGHYLKREYETMFVHRFGNNTMPFKRVFINSIHYWGIFGALVGYFFFHPRYTEPSFSMPVKYGLIAAFTLFQLLNYKAHSILRDLRKEGTNERGIPKGWGFGLVSCANYFYETLVWLSFAIFSGTATAYVFLIVSFVQMTLWAKGKHHRYRKEFKDYPRGRKAIIPFVI